MNATINPTAKIAVKKNVLKQYKVNNLQSVYLSDGTEFEIELFNPLSETILAKIFINGKSISDSGLVLYPAQRVFLERYFDSAKKFNFTTYIVDDIGEVDDIIKNNGIIEIKFFKQIYNTYYNSYIDLNSCHTSNPLIYKTKSYDFSTGAIGNYPSYTATNTLFCSDTKETGLVTEGSSSDQSFSYTSETYNPFCFSSTVIKILPQSTKPLDSEDLKYKKYCPECGSKVKHAHKFCSYCGNKL